ncbi:hypothetical protein [Devosia sp.]|uniref:hypothetical protein n=1 Tax=Devosia sp. TaxID=1871048 RepID=UPI0032679C72
MDEPKLSPFKLTGPRIIIVFFVVLAAALILSATLGGLNSYQHLKEGAQAAKDAAAAAPATN